MEFVPDYRHFLAVMNNVRPRRLPLYEHTVSALVMEEILGQQFASLESGDPKDLAEFYRHFCRFFQEMTYDTVSFEVCLADVLPEHGALSGNRPGPIQNRSDFESYPWNDIPKLFWDHAAKKFNALVASLPPGMKAVGGIGNGIFEISEDLVGLPYLPFMQVDDPDLYRDLYRRIGDLMVTLWTEFLNQYADMFVACRFGDDLGFRSSLLTNPATIRHHVVPQYRRVIDLVRGHRKPFLWHSCGCIFDIMDDVIAAGIQAKHSNEDVIAPFSEWIERYGHRIALLGGFDLGFLCQSQPDEIFAEVVRRGRQYRSSMGGYALGSGNSIPDFVPADNYLAMIGAAQAIRQEEGN